LLIHVFVTFDECLCKLILWFISSKISQTGDYVCCGCCSDVGIYDRVVIQELLKTVAQSHQLDSSAQRDFKG